MILIYSQSDTPRVTWTIDLVMGRLLGLEYRITTLPDEISSFGGPKINYSDSPMGDIPWIPASGLLFEDGISDQSSRLNPGTWKNLKTLFHTSIPEYRDLRFAPTSSTISTISTISTSSTQLLPFDLFSAVFYLVSRYEEYLPFEPDEHGRFPSSESLSFRMGILEEPVVNQWALAFGDELEKLFPDQIRIKKTEYRFLPTIDVDNAWAYAHKGWKRTIGGFWQNRKNIEARNFRFQVLRENQNDPYDTYNLIARFHQDAGVRAKWFFLIGEYGPFDKNISPHNQHFKKLIQRIARNETVGIHPSYGSNGSPGLVAREVKTLSGIIGQPVGVSRQHYLKISFPHTYRVLIRLGIREDYSMGYPDRPGFRAGIASPFRFFDLGENKPADFTVYPFPVMDQTLRQYCSLEPKEALARIVDLAEKVRRVGGTFITLWHNESLSEWNEWAGWTEVYRQMLIQVKSE
ncbi:MAG: polysaccharide deacetylase family protein [Bacteroidota bacterium]